MPFASIVPTVELPPAVPFTDHVTEVPAPPVAVTMNWRVSPTETVDVCGEMRSEAGVVGVLAVPPHPTNCRLMTARTKAIKTGRALRGIRSNSCLVLFGRTSCRRKSSAGPALGFTLTAARSSPEPFEPGFHSYRRVQRRPYMRKDWFL